MLYCYICNAVFLCLKYCHGYSDLTKDGHPNGQILTTIYPIGPNTKLVSCWGCWRAVADILWRWHTTASRRYCAGPLVNWLLQRAGDTKWGRLGRRWYTLADSPAKRRKSEDDLSHNVRRMPPGVSSPGIGSWYGDLEVGIEDDFLALGHHAIQGWF